MPDAITPNPGEDLATFASRTLGDPVRFRDIAALNNLNPLQTLSSQAALLVPTQEELSKALEPALESVRTGVTTTLADLTSQVQSYIPEVIRQAADINGIIGTVQGPLNDWLDRGAQVVYEGRTQLVDWLLDKTSAGTDTGQLEEARRL